MFLLKALEKTVCFIVAAICSDLRSLFWAWLMVYSYMWQTRKWTACLLMERLCNQGLVFWKSFPSDPTYLYCSQISNKCPPTKVNKMFSKVLESLGGKLACGQSNENSLLSGGSEYFEKQSGWAERKEVKKSWSLLLTFQQELTVRWIELQEPGVPLQSPVLVTNATILEHLTGLLFPSSVSLTPTLGDGCVLPGDTFWWKKEIRKLGKREGTRKAKDKGFGCAYKVVHTSNSRTERAEASGSPGILS